MNPTHVWQVRAADPALVAAVQSELGITEVTARVIVGRGATSVAEARQWLQADSGPLHDPWRLPDMEVAVDRLVRAYRQGEAVTVFGDYDADGQTATALVVTALHRLGVPVSYYIPSRFDEGYGLNADAVNEVADSGCTLLLTVDCGTTAAHEVALANRLGLDCIITDHHEPAGTLAPALAVINPKLAASAYPWPHLAGVGVAYKLMQALAERLARPEIVADALDLVAVGTIADVVPLRDENRTLAALGLQRLNREPRPGLAALVAVAGLPAGMLEAQHVAFQLAPRLNAGGRMDDAAVGVQMLVASSLAAAQPFAVRLDQENAKRQAVEEEILAAAREQAAAQQDAPVLVVAQEGWHQGVIGIVAARLVEQFQRPALVVALADGVGTGSARSVAGFHITAALEACAAHLQRFGGHALAAGFTVAADELPALRQALAQLATETTGGEASPPVLEVDAWVEPSALDTELLAELSRLGPFGHGNPEPVLAWAGATPEQVRVIGKEQNHLRFTLPVGRAQIAVVGFRCAHLAPLLRGQVDLAFTLTLNEWRGTRSLELRLQGLRSSTAAEESAGREATAALREVAATGTQAAPLVVNAGAYGGNPEAYVRMLLQRDLHPVVWALSRERLAALMALAAGQQAGRSRPQLAWPDSDLPKPQPPWCLVLIDPPVGASWRQMQERLVPDAALPAEVHLLYGKQEAALGWQCVERDWPDRTGLVTAYRALERLAAANVAVTASALAASTGLSLCGARRALQIFSELGLVTGDRDWKLMPRPGSKLDLTASVSYNDSIAKRQEAAGLLAENRPAAILQYLFPD